VILTLVAAPVFSCSHVCRKMCASDCKRWAMPTSRSQERRIKTIRQQAPKGRCCQQGRGQAPESGSEFIRAEIVARGPCPTVSRCLMTSTNYFLCVPS